MIHGHVKNSRGLSAIPCFVTRITIFPLSPAEFSQALFNAYHNRDLSAFLMAICQNTLFDLLRNSFLIPYRFNADGRTNPIIMTDESGNLLPGYKTTVHEKNYQHFYDVYCDLDNKKNIYFASGLPLPPCLCF